MMTCSLEIDEPLAVLMYDIDSPSPGRATR
jgi:hypothetical protein